MNKRGESQKKDEISCQDRNLSIVQQMYVWNWEGKFFPWMPISSFQFSDSVMSWLFANHGLQHTKPPCPTPAPGACSNSCPSSWWYHPTISSSVVPFSSCLQSFPALGSFPMNQLFATGGQNIGAPASESVLPKNIQDGFPLGLIVLISLLSKGLSRVFFSKTTVQKQQFFGTQLSLWSNSHIHTRLILENHSFD